MIGYSLGGVEAVGGTTTTTLIFDHAERIKEAIKTIHNIEDSTNQEVSIVQDLQQSRSAIFAEIQAAGPQGTRRRKGTNPIKNRRTLTRIQFTQ